jgi:hypothetical protein
MPTRENNEKMTYAKFIDYLEKNDPTGLSQTYFKTLIGKYEKTLANDGFVEADRKAYNYIKKNDPTGFIKYYYEKTEMGIGEKDFIKAADEELDYLDKDFDRTFKKMGEYLDRDLKKIGKFIEETKGNIKELFNLNDIVLNNPTNNNKNLPKKQIDNPINAYKNLG